MSTQCKAACPSSLFGGLFGVQRGSPSPEIPLPDESLLECRSLFDSHPFAFGSLASGGLGSLAANGVTCDHKLGSLTKARLSHFLLAEVLDHAPEPGVQEADGGGREVHRGAGRGLGEELAKVVLGAQDERIPIDFL